MFLHSLLTIQQILPSWPISLLISRQRISSRLPPRLTSLRSIILPRWETRWPSLQKIWCWMLPSHLQPRSRTSVPLLLILQVTSAKTLPLFLSRILILPLVTSTGTHYFPLIPMVQPSSKTQKPFRICQTPFLHPILPHQHSKAPILHLRNLLTQIVVHLFVPHLFLVLSLAIARSLCRQLNMTPRMRLLPSEPATRQLPGSLVLES